MATTRTRRPRRSRYTVQTNAGTKLVLAYDANGARKFYERQGLEVMTVAKGDLVAQAHIDKHKGDKFKISHLALREAAKQLGLTFPVSVTMNARQSATLGKHRLAWDHARGTFVHQISLKSWLNPESAGRTLWHELAHAVQSEKVALRVLSRPSSTVPAVYRAIRTAYRDGVSYSNKPWEVEARSWESRHDETPLTRSAR